MSGKGVVYSHYAVTEIFHGVKLLDLRYYIVAATKDVRKTLDLLHVAVVKLATAKQQLLRLLVQVLNFRHFCLVRKLVYQDDYSSWVYT